MRELLARLPGGSVVRAFRGDRPLTIAFVVLSVTVCLPLFATPLVPSPDLPGNVAGATLLFETALGRGVTPDYYQVLWAPLPYWTAYLLLGAASLLVGPFLAAKALIGLLVLGLPLATMRLAIALGRDPRIALAAFLLSWDRNVLAGWHSFALGMMLALIFAAKTHEARSVRDAIRAMPYMLLVALSHPLAIGFGVGLVSMLALTRRPILDRARLSAIACGPALVVVVPWIATRIRPSSEKPNGGSFVFDFPSLAEKVDRLFHHSMDGFTGRFAETAAALGFLVLLLGPMGLSLLARRSSPSGQRWSGAAVASTALLLYLALPMSILGPIDHWYTYPRFATYLLLALPLVPGPSLRGRGACVLLPVVALALACHLAAFRAFRAFAETARPFARIVDAVPRGARLLPLEYVDQHPSTKMAPLAHLHSYVTAAKVTYDPHLFDSSSVPIQYRRGLSLPRIPWTGPRGFAFERYAAFYDFILVQGLAEDPFVGSSSAAGYRARLVIESGIWRLYAIEKT